MYYPLLNKHLSTLRVYKYFGMTIWNWPFLSSSVWYLQRLSWIIIIGQLHWLNTQIPLIKSWVLLSVKMINLFTYVLIELSNPQHDYTTIKKESLSIAKFLKQSHGTIFGLKNTFIHTVRNVSTQPPTVNFKEGCVEKPYSKSLCLTYITYLGLKIY